jgi:hypothetical protein
MRPIQLVNPDLDTHAELSGAHQRTCAESTLHSDDGCICAKSNDPKHEA